MRVVQRLLRGRKEDARKELRDWEAENDRAPGRGTRISATSQRLGRPERAIDQPVKAYRPDRRMLPKRNTV